MIQRKKAEITIKDAKGNDIATIPITPSCRRRWKLGEEDLITLSFVWDSPLKITRGCYVDDELFGRFYATERQMPTPESNTRGWKHELTLHAPWKMLEGYIHTLNMKKGDVVYRDETTWSLTASLQDHLNAWKESANHAHTFGGNWYWQWAHAPYGYPTDIKAYQEARHIEYKGMDFIAALKAICETYETEWWFEGTTLYIGKCEDTEGEYLQLIDGVTCSALTANRNENETANKLFAFGDTKNLPYSYRKELIFTVTEKDDLEYSVGGNDYDCHCYKDNARPLSTSMLPKDETHTLGVMKSDEAGTTITSIDGTWKETSRFFVDRYNDESDAIAKVLNLDVNTEYTFAAVIRGKVEDFRRGDWHGTPKITARIRLYDSNGTIVDEVAREIAYEGGGGGGTTINTGDDITAPSGEPITPSEGTIITPGGETETEEIDIGELIPVLKPKAVMGNSAEGSGVNIALRHTCKKKGQYRCSLVIRIDCFIDYNPSPIVPEYLGDISFIDETTDNINKRINITAKTPVASGAMFLTKYPPQYNQNDEIIGARVLLNPNLDAEDSTGCWFIFDPEDSSYDILSDLQIGDRFQLGEYEPPARLGVGLCSEFDPIEVPDHYYTRAVDDPSSLLKINEARLRIPDNNRRMRKGQNTYHFPSDLLVEDGALMLRNLERSEVKEKIVAFDEEYPRQAFKVSKVKVEERDLEEQVGADGIKEWKWMRYTLELVDKDNNAVDFKFRWLLNGQKLQMKFITAADYYKYTERMDCGNSKLAGMTFEIDLEQGDGQVESAIQHSQYTIVRNEDYGAKLPSTELCPQVGDPVLLLGWNTKAMGETGLVEDAENGLADRAIEYLRLLQKPDVTFTAKLRPTYLNALRERIELMILREKSKKEIREQEEKLLRVEPPKSAYLLPYAGQRVQTSYNPLSGFVVLRTGSGQVLRAGGKELRVLETFIESRVLGYECPLDYPFDNPSVTVGESDVYSRIKQIEKKLTKIG